MICGVGSFNISSDALSLATAAPVRLSPLSDKLAPCADALPRATVGANAPSFIGSPNRRCLQPSIYLCPDTLPPFGKQDSRATALLRRLETGCIYYDNLPLPAGSRSKADRKLIARPFQGGKNDNRAYSRRQGPRLVTTQPDRTLAEVAGVLVAKNIGAVVVTDDQGSVIGILSERDIVRAVAKRGTAVFNEAVSMHMTTK